jgi:hypothetical protein
MKTWSLPVLATSVLIFRLSTAFAAEPASWVGEYTDKKFLNGRAVFQLSVEQSGGGMQVAFDAAHNDGHGAAPEGQGPAKVSGNTLQFKFEDSFGNTGTGTITRAADGVVVSMKTLHVAEPRCLAFYGENMRLKRVGKK